MDFYMPNNPFRVNSFIVQANELPYQAGLY
jgi:hypothetical protein